jgi:GTP-binding protein EngB required for normal cell division
MFHRLLITLLSEAIINKAEVPRVLIGVLGHTGSGKSSLINALVDEEMVLPCNAMRASTSAVVELSWNRSENPTEKYVAEIEFITPEEWMSEIEILAHDTKNRPEGEQLGIKSGNEASIAYAKLAAVYPGVEITKLLDMSPEQLHEEQDLSEILGKKTTVHEATPKKFSALINAYIDSSNRNGGGQGAYWPLVRLVKVFIKAPLLRNGLVLVDLPGLGDSNAGRANVAEKFIQNLHHIWVVADIVRAIDDSVAKELLGRSFKRQLLMEGRYDDDFVTFIMTKTDQINSMEVIRSLQGQDKALNEKLEEEIEQREALGEVKSQLKQLTTKRKQIEKVLKKLNKEKKGLGGGVASKRSPVRKRKFEERDEIEGASNKPGVAIANSRLSDIKKERQSLLEAQKDGRNDEKELTAKADQIEKVLANLKAAVDTRCIAARNRYTQSHLQIDFEGGLLELKQELMQLNEDGLTKLAKTSKAQGKLKLTIWIS